MSSISLIVVGVLSFRQFTKPKPWSDEREVEGSIQSVASGVIDGGREVVVAGGFIWDSDQSRNRLICCYDAATGQILWENHEVGYAVMPGLVVHVGLDSNGDVFTTSHKHHSEDNSVALLEKFSGSDGSRKWAAEFAASNWLPYDPIAPPVMNSAGDVWLTETIREHGRGITRLRLLSGKDGSVIAICDLTKSEKVCLPPETICLKGGGAIVFAFAGTSDQRGFRFSSEGRLLAGFPLVFSSGIIDTSNLRRHVDEESQRIIVSETVFPNVFYGDSSHIIQTAAFSMANGQRFWESSDTANGVDEGRHGLHPEIIRFRPNGDVEYRHEGFEIEEKFDWNHWRRVRGVPIPSRISAKVKRLERIIVSGADGKSGHAEQVKSAKNWFQIQEQEAGTATRELHTYQRGLNDSSARRCLDARRWLPEAPMTETGISRKCFRVIRTPSGRTILSRDPSDYCPATGYRNWQIMGL